jgi:hypothetical protein
MRAPWIAAATALGFAACFAFAATQWTYGRDGPVTNPLDFRAFYCAGAAVAAGRDPYRVEPLRGCERATVASAGLTMDPRRVLPAPLPPYALLGFAAVSALPYRIASEAWFASILVALSVAICVVAVLARLRPLPVAAAFFASLGTTSLAYGQVVPLAVAGLAVAALSARHGNRWGIAAGCAVAAVEPHLALPAWIGLALAVPPARAPLALTGAALAAASLLAGPAVNLEYVAAVLPEHARSEVAAFGGQYSLTSLLWAWGVPPTAALAAGAVSYAVMLAAGVLVGRAAVARTGDPAFAVTVPVAAALLGGPFLHDHQLAAAIPLGLMLAGRLRVRGRAWTAAVAAVCLLAIPWQSIAEFSAGRALLPQHRVVATAAAAPPAPRPDEIAEVPYAAFVDAFADRDDRRTRLEQTLWKLPSWLALAALAGLAARLAGRRPAFI